MEPKPKSDFTPIETLQMEALASRALIEAVRMKLFDELESPKTPTEIATACRIAEEGASVVLEMLQERGLITKTEGAYKNNPLASEFLVSHSPLYQGALLEVKQSFIELVTSEMGSLLHQPGSLEKQIFQKVPSSLYCESAVQYSIRGSLQDLVEVVIKQEGFSDMKLMCDLGGNHGRYSMALLDQNDHLASEILELPRVTPLSKEAIRETGYQERIAVKDFDLKADVLEPGRYDLVLVSHVLQMFADDLGNTIKKIGRGVKIGGLFVSQNMNPQSTVDPKLRTFNDMMARLLAHANHYLPEDVMKTALKKAGFVDIQTQPGGPGGTNLIVVARKRGD